MERIDEKENNSEVFLPTRQFKKSRRKDSFIGKSIKRQADREHRTGLILTQNYDSSGLFVADHWTKLMEDDKDFSLSKKDNPSLQPKVPLKPRLKRLSQLFIPTKQAKTKKITDRKLEEKYYPTLTKLIRTSPYINVSDFKGMDTSLKKKDANLPGEVLKDCFKEIMMYEADYKASRQYKQAQFNMEHCINLPKAILHRRSEMPHFQDVSEAIRQKNDEETQKEQQNEINKTRIRRELSQSRSNTPHMSPNGKYSYRPLSAQNSQSLDFFANISQEVQSYTINDHNNNDKNQPQTHSEPEEPLPDLLEYSPTDVVTCLVNIMSIQIQRDQEKLNKFTDTQHNNQTLAHENTKYGPNSSLLLQQYLSKSQSETQFNTQNTQNSSQNTQNRPHTASGYLNENGLVKTSSQSLLPGASKYSFSNPVVTSTLSTVKNRPISACKLSGIARGSVKISPITMTELRPKSASAIVKAIEKSRENTTMKTAGMFQISSKISKIRPVVPSHEPAEWWPGPDKL